MNYRHAFHAGNHTEVFKHAILAQLICSLRRKAKAFFVLDTHSGPGQYDLQSSEAQKTKEFTGGIALVLDSHAKSLEPYLSVVRAHNQDGLRTYPGSPQLVCDLMREYDRAAMCELNVDDFYKLQRLFRRSSVVATHLRNGYEGLLAMVPPRERRGLVFIDPPYEQPNEIKTLAFRLLAAYEKWPTGVFAAWYPVKTECAGKYLKAEIRKRSVNDSLAAEFLRYPVDGRVLAGSGMVILNAPWHFDRLLRTLCVDLAQAFDNHSDIQWSVRWLVHTE